MTKLVTSDPTWCDDSQATVPWMLGVLIGLAFCAWRLHKVVMELRVQTDLLGMIVEGQARDRATK